MRKEYKVRILSTEFVTQNVKRFIVEKPKGYQFIPGQATLVSINKPGLKKEKHPFTFTSLNDDLVLEFMIKVYLQRHGLTEKLHQLEPGDELILRPPWGTISYQGEGVFIAGGAGITPFIAILRRLKKQEKLKGNRLLLSNKTQKDIILEKELKAMFDRKGELILTLTREKKKGYEFGHIDKEFLKKWIRDFQQKFYICGPHKLVEDVKRVLSELGVASESLVFER